MFPYYWDIETQETKEMTNLPKSNYLVTLPVLLVDVSINGENKDLSLGVFSILRKIELDVEGVFGDIIKDADASVFLEKTLYDFVYELKTEFDGDVFYYYLLTDALVMVDVPVLFPGGTQEALIDRAEEVLWYEGISAFSGNVYLAPVLGKQYSVPSPSYRII